MPRAHRHFLAGHVWHVTHRCHERAFLLKFARDRRRYLQWLFEAKKRFGLCVLDYMVTCNHIHLLLKDDGSDVVACSLKEQPSLVGPDASCNMTPQQFSLFLQPCAVDRRPLT